LLDKLGQIAGMMKNLPRIKEEMGKFEQKLAEIVATGTAGGGMVTVTANGKMHIQRCALTDEALQMNDREMLEDLIQAATNQALDKARELVQSELAKTASGLGLPPGMGLPGIL
jgi:hypothetical protein